MALQGKISTEKIAILNKILDNYTNYGRIKLENPHDDGGPGSGNFGHKGVPGQVGVSAPSSGANVSGASGNTTASPSSGTQSSGNSGNVQPSSGNTHLSSPQDVRKELEARIANGKISTKLDAKKQSDHIVGSDRYNKRIAKGDHPSILEIPEGERQAFIDQYVENGELTLRRDGSIRVQFKHSSDVGTWVSEDGSETAKTNRGSIHLSKTGTHIVPEEPETI